MRTSVLVALALALPLLAGCSSTPAAPSSEVVPDAPMHGSVAFDAPVVAEANCARCVEPTIATDANGTIYIAGFRTPGILVSSDAGKSYVEVPKPPFPSPSPLAGSGSDDLVQVAPWGELFFTVLVTESFYNTPGVQVAGSFDGGKTWDTNVFVHPRTVPGNTAFISDRQWLAFDGDSTVYLVWNSGASVTESVTRSDDRGATFGTPVVAATPKDHSFPSPGGNPAVGPKGELVVPYFVLPRTDGQIGAHGVGVAVSKDGGKSFTNQVVWQHETLATGAGFPHSAALANGSLVVSWSTNDDSAWFSFSNDGGSTWSDALQISPDLAHANSYPWSDARPGGGFDAVWFASLDGGERGSRMARFLPDGHILFGDLHGKQDGDTDFSTLAHLPDGRAVSAFVSGDGPLISVVESAQQPTTAA